MLSTCLALSLTLAGCGGTGQDETHQEIAAAPITVDGPSITFCLDKDKEHDQNRKR